MARTTVTGAQVGDGEIQTIDLANLAVTSAKIATGAVTDAQVAAANKDGAATTPSLRTLGAGAAQASAGNHAHAFAELTTKPTTVAGYGITDAVSTSLGYYIGTTLNTLNRASVAQTLSGVSIDGNAATATNSTKWNGYNIAAVLYASGSFQLPVWNSTNQRFEFSEAPNIKSWLGAPAGNTLTGNVLSLNNIKLIDLSNNNPSAGPLNTNWAAIRGSGRSLYRDEEFVRGSNDVVVYNNSGGTGVTHTREASTTSPNVSGFVIKISIDGVGATNPVLGGFIQAINSRANGKFVQIFRAKIPVGYSVEIAENSQGSGATSYWATNNVGTGKWEEYTRVSLSGDTGPFSSGGHVYLNGPAGAVIWYLASSNVYDLTATDYAREVGNIVNTVVLRDGSGGFSAGTITANSLTATNVGVNGVLYLDKPNGGTHTYHQLNRNAITTESMFLWRTANVDKWYLGQRSKGNEDGFSLFSTSVNEDAMYFNPNGNVNFRNDVTAKYYYGSGVGLTGTAANLVAGAAGQLQLFVNNSTNADFHVLFSGNSGVYSSVNVNGGVVYNPSTGKLTAGFFSGAGTGLTGTANGLSIGGNAATANAATNSTQLGGMDSSRFVYGDGSRGRSKDRTNGNANTSDSNNSSGFYFGHNVAGMPTTDWWNWSTVAGEHWGGTDGYGYQQACSFWNDDFRLRRLTSGGWNPWVSIIHSGNIGGQSVSKAAEAANNYFFVRGTSPTIELVDTDQAQSRYLHHNGGSIGFLTAAGAWSYRQADGNAYFTGGVTADAFYATSDMRLKDLVVKDNAAEQIQSITYVWKDKSKGEVVQVGYSAQEVRQYMPDAVNEDDKGMLSVNYIQVLVAKVAMLEKQLKQLQDVV